MFKHFTILGTLILYFLKWMQWKSLQDHTLSVPFVIDIIDIAHRILGGESWLHGLCAYICFWSCMTRCWSTSQASVSLHIHAVCSSRRSCDDKKRLIRFRHHCAPSNRGCCLLKCWVLSWLMDETAKVFALKLIKYFLPPKHQTRPDPVSYIHIQTIKS